MASGFQGGNSILKPLKWYHALADARERRDRGYFLIEGHRAVRQIHEVSPSSIAELLVTEENPAFAGIPFRVLSESQLRAVCTSRTPQGIAAVVSIPDDVYGTNLPEPAGHQVLLLESIQDPGNVGTLIRTAAALDYSGVIMSEECADPFSSKVVQASAGAILSVWIRRISLYKEFADELKTTGHVMIAADLRGDDVSREHAVSPLILALGNEGAGLSAGLLEKADKRIRIPMNSQKVESLNVAVSGGILMHVLRPKA